MTKCKCQELANEYGRLLIESQKAKQAYKELSKACFAAQSAVFDAVENCQTHRAALNHNRDEENDCVNRVDSDACHGCNGHNLLCSAYMPPQRPDIGPEGP